MVKKTTPQTVEHVKFHWYDVIGTEDYSSRFSNFWNENEQVEHCKLIVRVPTYKTLSKKEMDGRHSLNIAEGYEGSILRWGTEGYKKNGRSSHLLKVKDFLDETATIIDVVPMDARPEQGVLVCRLTEGSQELFKASLKLSFSERSDVLKNKKEYIGKTAEIRFFELTDSGLPRFPVCVGFRLDK